ncbi:MAG: hypothetical protein AB8B83_08565 [Bdellovibrionales bacterium]
MNDLLKLASNALKPLGYHIIRHGAPNILRISNLEKECDSLKPLRTSQYGENQTENTNLDSFIVYLRICMRKNRNIDTKARLTKTDIQENTLRCVNSLIKSMNEAKNLGDINLMILDDRSDEEALKALQTLLKTAQFPFMLKQTDKTGQGESLYEQFCLGKEQNAITYFVEDDFLHEKDGISSVWAFYKQIYNDFKTHCMIHPQEHCSLHSKYYPSYIIASPDRHWRTIRHATHTLLTHGHIVRDYWRYFENTKYVGVKKKRKRGSEAKTTNKIFNHIPGFAPLQPFAVHLQQEGLLPPYYDWKPLWEANKIKD